MFYFRFSIGFKGTYLEVICDEFCFSLSLLGKLGGAGSTNSVIIFMPRESSTEITLGGGVKPPSADECLSRIVLLTSARLLADKTDKEVGGRLVPTIPSFEDTEDMDPPELGKDRCDRPVKK